MNIAKMEGGDKKRSFKTDVKGFFHNVSLMDQHTRIGIFSKKTKTDSSGLCLFELTSEEAHKFGPAKLILPLHLFPDLPL